MRFSTALFHAKNAALLVLLWAGSLWAYPQLPDAMPGHFDLLGQVSYRTDTTLARWLLMPILGLLLTATLYGIAHLMRRFPSIMNVPDPATFQQLTPDRRAVVIHLVQDVVYGIAALVLLVLTVLQVGIYSVAVYKSSVLPVHTRTVLWSSIPLLAVLGPVMVWGVHRITQRLYREQKR
ncbi:hypothetical protein CRI93_04615 [Longimonas halophila]|uniref:DUF1648 domain-containing protein n=1 Tax=Longimonas halophila TaxID=1469170 RepID=A0A2H3NNJ1_9BACT|nr:DUF1648 domain-containing protein [Longimonas halophila]PEN08400.1 hypothetical protein CRI93_04615 [Longimonas halophila]